MAISINDEVLGAMVGALLGTIGAFTIGILVERRAKKDAHTENDKAKAREYTRNLMLAEVSCQEISIVLVDGIKLLDRIPASVKSGTWMVTLPRKLSPSEVSTLGLRNYELVNMWTSLKFKLDLTNHLIGEFVDYYSKLAATYEQRAIDGTTCSDDIVGMHRTAIKSYAHELRGQLVKTLDDLAEVYALILSHAEARVTGLLKVDDPNELHKFNADIASKAKNLAKIKSTIRDML